MTKTKETQTKREPKLERVTITVPSEEIAAVAGWSYTEKDRPHLRVVAFQHACYTAVDGHRLVSVPIATFGARFGVTREAVFAAVAAQRALGCGTDLALTPVTSVVRGVSSKVRIDLGLGNVLEVPLDDLTRFPDTKPVDGSQSCEGTVPPAGYHVDPRYLADMALVHGANCRGRPGTGDTLSLGVKLVSWEAGKLGPLVFKNANGVRFVIMPIRGDIP